MELKTSIKVGIIGTIIEAAGLFLDILHHLKIGIKTPEGLLTFNHFTIFFGFVINLIGVLLIIKSKTTKGG